MKTMRIIGTMILGLFLLTGSSLYAQNSKDKEADRKADQEKEMLAKKEMLEKQHLEMKELEALMRVQEFESQERESGRESSRARVFISSTGDSDYTYFFDPDERGIQSQLTLRNTFNGGSDSSKGEFEVDEGIRKFRCMIRGKVREGEIEVRVLYPGGKVFKELTITSSAEVSFTQSLSIKDDSAGKYEGSWTYEVQAKEAKGDYTLSISTE